MPSWYFLRRASWRRVGVGLGLGLGFRVRGRAPGAQGGVSTADRPQPKDEARPLIEPQAMLFRLLCRESGRPHDKPAKPGRSPGSLAFMRGLTLEVGLGGVPLRSGTGWWTSPGSLASYPWKRGGGWHPSRSTCTNAPLSLRCRHEVRDLSRALLASAAFVKTARGGDLKSNTLGDSRPLFGLAPAVSISVAPSCSAATSSASSKANAMLAALRSAVGVPALLIRVERRSTDPGLFFDGVLFLGVLFFGGLLGAGMAFGIATRRKLCLMTRA